MASVCILTAVACGGAEKTSLTGLGGGPVGPPGTGGGGTGGFDPLVGLWRNILIVQVAGDFQRTETTWAFDIDLTCSRTVETFSVQQDRLFFNRRDCTYLVNPPRLAVWYAEAEEQVFFDFRFPESTRDVVVIDQFRFDRIF